MRLTVPVVATMTLWLCLADTVGAARAATQAAVGSQPRVLVLYGSRRDATPATSLETALRRTLEAELGPDLDLYSEYLDVVRFEDVGYQSAMRALIRQQYAGIGVDVVIAICDTCANFAEARREERSPAASLPDRPRPLRKNPRATPYFFVPAPEFSRWRRSDPSARLPGIMAAARRLPRVPCADDHRSTFDQRRRLLDDEFEVVTVDGGRALVDTGPSASSAFCRQHAGSKS